MKSSIFLYKKKNSFFFREKAVSNNMMLNIIQLEYAKPCVHHKEDIHIDISTSCLESSSLFTCLAATKLQKKNSLVNLRSLLLHTSYMKRRKPY